MQVVIATLLAVALQEVQAVAVVSLVDQEARSLRRIAEEAEEVKRQAHAEIMTNRFATEGTAMYPDATFSLRLAYGLVKGYGEDGPRRIAPITTYAGLFARATAKRETPPL